MGQVSPKSILESSTLPATCRVTGGDSGNPRAPSIRIVPTLGYLEPQGKDTLPQPCLHGRPCMLPLSRLLEDIRVVPFFVRV